MSMLPPLSNVRNHCDKALMPLHKKTYLANTCLSVNIGLITSRCSGKEPALLPRTHGWTRGLGIVNLDQ